MRVLLFFGFVLLLASCRKEEEVKKCDCTLQEYSRSLTYKDDGKTLRRIDSTAWNKFNSEYYGDNCEYNNLRVYRNLKDPKSIKYNKDGTMTVIQEEGWVTCK